MFLFSYNYLLYPLGYVKQIEAYHKTITIMSPKSFAELLPQFPKKNFDALLKAYFAMIEEHKRFFSAMNYYKPQGIFAKQQAKHYSK